MKPAGSQKIVNDLFGCLTLRGFCPANGSPYCKKSCPHSVSFIHLSTTFLPWNGYQNNHDEPNEPMINALTIGVWNINRASGFKVKPKKITNFRCCIVANYEVPVGFLHICSVHISNDLDLIQSSFSKTTFMSSRIQGTSIGSNPTSLAATASMTTWSSEAIKNIFYNGCHRSRTWTGTSSRSIGDCNRSSLDLFLNTDRIGKGFMNLRMTIMT